jgi:hypothetical protein
MSWPEEKSPEKTRALVIINLASQGDTSKIVKLPVHRTGLPGKELSFHIVPLDPAYKAGLAGHVPVKNSSNEYLRIFNLFAEYLPFFRSRMGSGYNPHFPFGFGFTFRSGGGNQLLTKGNPSGVFFEA